MSAFADNTNPSMDNYAVECKSRALLDESNAKDQVTQGITAGNRVTDKKAAKRRTGGYVFEGLAASLAALTLLVGAFAANMLPLPATQALVAPVAAEAEGSVAADADGAAADDDADGPAADERDESASSSAKSKSAGKDAAGKSSSDAGKSTEAKPAFQSGSLKASFKTHDGRRYTVTLDYGKSARIPEGAQLQVVQLVQRPSKEELAKKGNEGRPSAHERFVSKKDLAKRRAELSAAVKLKEDEEAFYEELLDLSIVNADGREVQPGDDVKVTVETDAVAKDDAGDVRASFYMQVPKGKKAAPALKLKDSSGSKAKDKAYKDGAKLSFKARPLSELGLMGVRKAVKEPAADEPAAGEPKATGEGEGDSASDDDADADQADSDAADAHADGIENAEAPEAAEGDVAADAEAAVGESAGEAPTPSEAADGTGEGSAGESDIGEATAEESGAAESETATENAAADDADADAASIESGDGETVSGENTATGDAESVAESKPAEESASAEEGMTADADATAEESVPAGSDATETETETEASDSAKAPAAPAKALKAAYARDGKAAKVVLSYTEDAAIPDGAALRVRELSGAEYERARAKAEKAVDGGDASYARAFDIAILDADGKEVEPAAPVSVAITLADVPAAGDTSVVHLDGRDAEVIEPEVAAKPNGAASGAAVSFEAGSFSVYVVLTTVKEQVLTASDGKQYKVTVAYDTASGIPEDAELAVTELTSEDASYEAYVKQTAEALDKDVEQLAFAHAFDIKLVDPKTGKGYQPEKKVKVSIDLLDENLNEGDELSVVHFKGDADEASGQGGKKRKADTQSSLGEAEILRSNVTQEGIVEFETDGFSVYVVSSDQRGYIYKFMSPEHSEYTQLRQTVFDGDTLVKPVAPSEFGRVFQKWIWKGLEGTDDDFSDFNGWGEISVPNTQRGMVDVEVTAQFTDNDKQHHVLFNDQDENVYNQITYKAGAHIDPNGTEDAANKVSYTVIQKKTGQFLTFGYWTEDLYDLDAATGNPKPFEPQDITRDITLYPFCPQAHWLHFDVNKAAAGNQSLGFVSPRIVLEGEVPTSVSVPTATGYTFDGWYTKADANSGSKVYDADGNIVAATTQKPKPGSTTEFFDYEFETALYTGGDSLDYDPTLYAHWRVDDKASATIALYIQREGDVYDATGNGRGYHFDFSGILGIYEQLDVGGTIKLVGNTVQYVSNENVESTLYTININDVFPTAGSGLTDAEISANEKNRLGFEIDTARSVNVTIETGNSTSFKVYLSRKAFKAIFYTGTTINSNQVSSTIEALYGEDISGRWPANSSGIKIWKDLDQSTSSLNVINGGIFNMPPQNKNFGNYSTTNTGDTHTRYYIQKVNATNVNDNNSYELYNTQSFKGVVTKSPARNNLLEGFTFIRLNGSNDYNTTHTTPNKQWVLSEAYKTLADFYTDPGTSINPYKTANNTYYLDVYYARNTHTITLRVVLDGALLDGDAYVKTSSYLYGQPLSVDTPNAIGADFPRFSIDNTKAAAKDDNGNDAYWFYDQECTNAVDFSVLEKMPNRDLVLYENLKTAYPVDIDPQGGEMDGVAQSTYFSVNKDEPLAEYTITRDYVEWSELYESKAAIPAATKLYKYVYNSRASNDGTRSAQYVEMTAEERADDSITAYVYYPGLWQFQYWYEDGHSNMPFNFVTPPNRPVAIFAKWVHAGNYSIVYNADNGGKSYRVPKDAELYREGAEAVVKPSVDQPGDKQFRFWATAPQAGTSLSLPDGVEKFSPNERLTIDAHYTPGQMEQTERVITLYAWYENGAFTSDSFADYEFYLPESNGSWLDGQGGRQNKPYYKQTISPGETLIMPMLPTGASAPEGTFIGWYEDSEFEERFTGFGEISTPVNHKLYARFAEVHTVTYKEPGDDGRTISVQTYFDGELLSTLGVEFTTTADKYVSHWAGSNNINYNYMGKGVNLSNHGSDYDNASDEVKQGCVKASFVLTPVTENVCNLSFDAQGGSYVAPIEMPHDITRWVAEPLTTREAFRFDGWFTAPKGQTNDVYPGIEGGVQYKFDKPLTQWAADPDNDSSTDTVVNLTRNNPLRLYAHWTPTGDPIPTTVKVNYWIQNTDRTGYFLWNSETVSETAAGARISVGSTYALTDAHKSTDKIAGYETFPDGNDATDDRDYFVLSTAASAEGDDYVSYATETSKTALENGETTLNVYFNRKVYTLVFQPDGSVTKNQKVGEYWRKYATGGWRDKRSDAYADVTYSINGKIGGQESYPIAQTWLGADVSNLWPNSAVTVEGSSHSHNAPAQNPSGYYLRDGLNATYDSVFYFNGWTEYKGTSTTDKTNTFNNVAASQSYIGRSLLPDAAQTTYTLRAEYQANTNPANSAVTVHYMLKKPGATGTAHNDDNYYEAPEYEQTVYGISGNPSTYSDATWNKILSQATPVDGYEREDQKDGKVVSGGTITYIPLYTYNIAADTYYHRFGGWGNLAYAEIFLAQSKHSGNSQNGDGNHPAGNGVREGQYSLYYQYLIGRARSLSSTDVAYIFQPGEATHNSWTVRGAMSVTDLKALLEETKQLTGWDQIVKNDDTYHVYLYYDMQSYSLTLKSAESDSTIKTAQVQYSKYLTNEDGTLGYIRSADGLNFTPPSVPGKSFAYWSLSKDSTSAWEGVMPNQPFELWAHYEDTKVTVTALGVQQNGALRRDGDKSIMRDANNLPLSWADDGVGGTNDYASEKKAYGTRFQEFEPPIPSLESGEIFYGWKRVENGKMVGGYLSNTQAITGDIVVAPDIAVNKGGNVAYYANGATNDGLTTTNKYEEDGFLYEEGGYYFGATAKAKIGTKDGTAPTATNVALTKGEFAFICWNTKADGGGDSYFPGDSIALPDSGVVKLYAQYASKREVTLVYHINLPADFTSDAEADQSAPGFVKLPLQGTFAIEMVDQGLNGETGIEAENREDTNAPERVLKIAFKDYLEDSAKYPNSQYPSSVDSVGNEFTLYCPGHTFLNWNTARNGSDEVSLRTDDVRINTLNKDANGEIHLYAQWDSVVLPVQVYEVTPGHIEDQYRLRAVRNTGSATHIDNAGNSSLVNTPEAAWGNPYNSFLRSNEDKGDTAADTAVTWYMADVRHGVDPKDSYLKSVLSTDEDVQIKYVRFDSTANVWQYSSSDATAINGVGDDEWKDFSLGDELKMLYERPQYMVFFNYNGGTDSDSREYRGESAEAVFSGTNTAELPIIDDVSRNGYQLVGWSMKIRRADLPENAALPTDGDFYAIDPDDAANNATIPLIKSGSGESLEFHAGRSGATKVRLYQTYQDSQNDGSLLYAVWRVSPWICRITDGNTLLYYNSGTDRDPVYTEAQFTSLNAAYNAMGKLYRKSGQNYTAYSAKRADAAGKDTRLEMLVSSYTLQRGDNFTWGANANTYYKLTLTTAPSVSGVCTINHGTALANATRMFTIQRCDMTFAGITIDGGNKGDALGGIVYLNNNDSKLTLDDGATLQNGKAATHGGAIDIEDGELVMNAGSTIDNCTAGHGGGVYVHPGSLFTMNGGTIEDCSATSAAVYAGGGVCLIDGAGGTLEMVMKGGATIKNCTAPNGSGGGIAVGHHVRFDMQGGAITGCSARDSGGAVEIHGDMHMSGGEITGNTCTSGGAVSFWDEHDHTGSGRIYFSGSPKIYANTQGSVERNVDTEKLGAGTNNYYNKINVEGALNSDAHVGVYAPATPVNQKDEGKQFGRYSVTDKDNFGIFKNDKDIYLVGRDGGGNKLVWGRVICKIVETGTTPKTEHAFHTLNSAVAYARAYGNGQPMSASNLVKIEMLVDYAVPQVDAVSLDAANDNILLTTAKTQDAATAAGERYCFTPTFTAAQGRSTEYNADGSFKSGDSIETAILQRGWDAADSAMVTISTGKITIENVIFDGKQGDTQRTGRAINASGGQLTVSSTTIRGFNNSGNGGAVYVADGATMTMGSATIAGNGVAAGKAGAGIYLEEGARLELSGAPTFTIGAGEGQKANLVGTGENAKRQDIYIAGYLGTKGGTGEDADDPVLAQSLVVTGKLYEGMTAEAAKGSIWVGAEVAAENATDAQKENNHWDMLKQFAQFADALMTGEGDERAVDPDKLGESDVEKILGAFRNATISDEYYGATGENVQCLYWDGVRGVRQVVLRKVDGVYESLDGAVFQILKRGKPVAGTDVNGNEDATSFPTTATSGATASGTFYAGAMDYGVYVLHETTQPSGYSGGPYFYLVVDGDLDAIGDGVIVSSPSDGYSTEAAAKAAGDAVFNGRQYARKNASGNP